MLRIAGKETMLDFTPLLAQQSTMPQFDGMYGLQLLSRLGHILSAIILVGGLFYIRQVLRPTGDSSGRPSADALFGGSRAGWAKWVGITTALLLATGLLNYVLMIKQHERLASSYHMLAGMKMLIALVVFVLAALLAGRTAMADSFRQKWQTWLTLCLLLAIITVAVGSVLRTYPRTRKAGPTAAPQLIAPANPTPQ